MFNFFVVNGMLGGLRVFKKFEGVYLTKKNRSSLLFGYYNTLLDHKHLFLGTSKAIHSKPNENCTARRKHGVIFAINCSLL